jgi:hypothetical protein
MDSDTDTWHDTDMDMSDTANVKNIWHRQRYIYVNLFKDGLKWKLKYIYKHLTWAIYIIRKSFTTRYHIIWPLFIHLLLKKLKMIQSTIMSITPNWSTFLKTYVTLTLVSMVCGSKREKELF